MTFAVDWALKTIIYLSIVAVVVVVGGVVVVVVAVVIFNVISTKN